MREFLKGLDLDKETIDTIMAEHGKHVQGLKEQIDTYKTQAEQYKAQVGTLESQIEEKDNSLKDFENVTNENKNLKAQISVSESNAKKEFKKFVTSEVLSKVDDKTDFETALTDYKKENPQYFGDTVVKKVQTSPTLNNTGTQGMTTNDIMNNILRNSRGE